MEREQKRMLAFGIIIALVITSSIIYFLWGSFINRGTLEVVGDAPFVVKVFNDKEYQCGKSPCEIQQKSGLKDLIIEKNGYRTVLTEAEVKLWRTVVLEVNFEIIPYMEKIETIPPQDLDVEYKLMKDENSSQKLVKSNDERATALAYFPNAFKNPQIFGSKNNVLIVDRQTSYLVNLTFSRKEKIEDPGFRKIKSAKWSPNGKYLVFEKNDSESLWLLKVDEKIVQQLDIQTPITAVGWDDNGDLIFATEQAFEEQNGNFFFGSYQPKKDIYADMGAFTEIVELPTDIYLTPDARYLYFKSGDESFRIVLSKTSPQSAF